MARSPSSSLSRSHRPLASLGAISGVLATAVALAGASAATSAPVTPSAVGLTSTTAVAPADTSLADTSPAAVAPTTASVTVGSLAMTGTTTTITVRRVYRRGQMQWINHVLDTRLLGLDGCQAQRTRASWDRYTYSTTVRTVCADGAARPEAAARKLVADRPWYRVKVRRVSLVGFGLLVDQPSGNDRAVPATMAKLPSGPFTFAEGDDLSLNYVGQSVTQTQLDAAVAAFAAALDVPTSAVEITPLATS